MTEYARLFWSAFVRKIAYILAAVLLGFVFSHHARADGQACYAWTYYGTVYPTGADVKSAVDAYLNSSLCGTDGSACPWKTTVDNMGAPSGLNDTNVVKSVAANGGVSGPNTFTAVAAQCPQNNCKSGAVYDINPPGNAAVAEGTSVCASDGCDMTMGPAANARNIITAGFPGGSAIHQSATVTGRSCGGAQGTEPSVQKGSQLDVGTPVTDCTVGGGNTTCAVQNAAGQYCGTYNGDYVCMGQVQSGTCQAYSSGAVACTVPAGASAMPSPPGPDNGTAGQPADPTMQMSTPSGTAGAAQQTNYYSAPKVAASTIGAQTVGAGTSGSSNGSTGAGLGSSSGGSGSGSSSSGGATGSASADCDTPPLCTDDSVYCAQLKQIWLVRCQTVSDDDIASAAGPYVPVPSVDAGSLSGVLSETGPVTGGVGVCPAPVQITVVGRTVTIDLWSKLCEFAAAVSFAVMLAAYAVAANILLGGVTGRSSALAGGQSA